MAQLKGNTEDRAHASHVEAQAPTDTAFPEYRQEVERIWNHNSAHWDDYMGEGNDFVEVLCWPAIEELMSIQPEQLVLDIACGNGLTSRRLGSPGGTGSCLRRSTRNGTVCQETQHA